jgi:hypothetical protein
MLWTPLRIVVVLNVATPEEFTFAVPSRVEPLKKLTVPTVEPVGAGVITAVKVMDCPAGEGLGEAVRAVVVVVVVGVAATPVPLTSIVCEP